LGPGLAMCLLAAGTWLSVDLISGNPDTRLIFEIWNAAVRLAFFLAFTWLVHRARIAAETIRQAKLRLESGVAERTEQLQRELEQRTRTEEALRLSEERFAKAFNACPIAMTLQEIPDGRYQDVNEAFVQSLGFKKAEVIGRTPLELNFRVHPEARAEMVQ